MNGHLWCVQFLVAFFPHLSMVLVKLGVKVTGETMSLPTKLQSGYDLFKNKDLIITKVI